jgi:hypothetical protein
MANRGYDVVVDVDQEGDLGHTDLQEDLEFHSSSTYAQQYTPASSSPSYMQTHPEYMLTIPDFDSQPNSRNKIQPDTSSSLPFPTTSSSSARKHYLWSLSFYAQAFDVDTNEVLRRCTATIYPRQNFLDVLEGNPDLYGPIWIATTVAVILFLTGTISQYLAHTGQDHFTYDFKLLSSGTGMIYGYTAIVPVALWGALKWWGSESANLMEVIALYGYSNLIWIPVALISWSPISSAYNPFFPSLPVQMP